MKNEIVKIKKLLSKPKAIVIVCHRNPDGDAYGSSLALYHFLIKLNHNVTIISPNDCPNFLKWMPGQSEIILFENDEKKATEILNNAEIIFTLDFNAFHRTGKRMQLCLEKLNVLFIMIDHHHEPDDYAKYQFSEVEKSSTCEMIYDFIENLGQLDKIDQKTATCIYAGIMTDTGSFRFPATTSRTHTIIAFLLEKGANNSLIYNQIMDDNSINRMKLLGSALSNLVVLEQFKTAFISLSQTELKRFNFKKGDTEGFVNHALSIRGIVFTAIFIEDKMQNIIKISFRSKGVFSVNEFARKHFDGGGHTNAAGGKSEISLIKTIRKFVELVPNYKNELKNSYEI